MRGAEQEVVAPAVLQPEEVGAVLGPAAGRLVGLAGQQRREVHLLRAHRVHLLADDALDVAEDPEAQRQPGEPAGRGPPDVAGADEQPVARDLGVGRVVTQGPQEQGRHPQQHAAKSPRRGERFPSPGRPVDAVRSAVRAVPAAAVPGGVVAGPVVRAVPATAVVVGRGRRGRRHGRRGRTCGPPPLSSARGPSTVNCGPPSTQTARTSTFCVPFRNSTSPWSAESSTHQPGAGALARTGDRAVAGGVDRAARGGRTRPTARRLGAGGGRSPSGAATCGAATGARRGRGADQRDGEEAEADGRGRRRGPRGAEQRVRSLHGTEHAAERVKTTPRRVKIGSVRPDRRLRALASRRGPAAGRRGRRAHPHGADPCAARPRPRRELGGHRAGRAPAGGRGAARPRRPRPGPARPGRPRAAADAAGGLGRAGHRGHRPRRRRQHRPGPGRRRRRLRAQAVPGGQLEARIRAVLRRAAGAPTPGRPR